ncbi:LysR family transcriptional regulator [Jiangella aurantiaca]|uniref:LysR family transcriptional regulator n=1 Tax=Jiangella aurantiaca TaxID=2530373 RepID=A0A4R5AKX7_9ACTN|nr:LysR family transcriptional regulator [Jiangella aurantiaca]
MDVRDLRYFVAVAEELNFSRAAGRLGIAQPPLSRAIRQLERRLGAPLFHRDTRTVALTELGASVLDDARHALDVLAGVSRRAHRAAQAVPTLVVTAKPGIATGMARRIVDAYAALPGAIRVTTVVSGYREQAAMVRDGRADVALLSSFFDARGLDSEPLTVERRVAALPAGHRLAAQAQLTCADLRGEPIPRWPGASVAERAYWTGQDQAGAFRRGDELAPAGPEVHDPAQLIEVVALGQAVALIPRSLAEQHPRADVAYRPVADATPYTIAAVWPENSRSPHIARLVRTATDLYGSGSDAVVAAHHLAS